jgi:Mg2+-importing ATPase
VTTSAVVLVGAALPWSPLAGLLGLVPPPPAFFLFLVGATATYLALVEAVKRRVMGRLGAAPAERRASSRYVQVG